MIFGCDRRPRPHRLVRRLLGHRVEPEIESAPTANLSSARGTFRSAATPPAATAPALRPTASAARTDRRRRRTASSIGTSVTDGIGTAFLAVTTRANIGRASSGAVTFVWSSMPSLPMARERRLGLDVDLAVDVHDADARLIVVIVAEVAAPPSTAESSRRRVLVGRLLDDGAARPRWRPPRRPSASRAAPTAPGRTPRPPAAPACR